MSTYEKWSLAISASAVAVNAGLLAVVLLQLAALRRQLRNSSDADTRDHDRRRKQATIEAIMSTMNDRRALRGLLPSDSDAANIKDLIATCRVGRCDFDKEAAVADYLGLWENLALGVNAGVLDLDMMDRLAGTRILHLTANYQDWFSWRREQWKSNSLFTELELMAGTIKRRRSSSRPPPPIALSALPPMTD